MTTDWMLYGATGFTGQLLIEAAVARGHRPLLAGRSADKLAPLAERYGLTYRAFGLDDLDSVVRGIRDMALVLHAAGPLVLTSPPMLRACTLAGVHYLDITGEIPVFEGSMAYDQAARQRGIAVIPGVGFDVVPSTCLAQYVADQVPGAVHLDIAIHGLTRASAGTARTAVVMGSSGGWIRRQGQLRPYPLGAGARRLRFPDGEKTIMPIPWGDLSTAYRSTGIPNVTTYFVVPAYLPPLALVGAPIGQVLLSLPPTRALLSQAVGVLFKGPNPVERETLRALLWAKAADDDGHSVEAWLETVEPYRFTALAGVRAVERTLADQPTGTLTPAQAFGADFVLEIDGSRRWDHLPET
jgi:short subunit dehydrogenase-like uncharacterized protein